MLRRIDRLHAQRLIVGLAAGDARMQGTHQVGGTCRTASGNIHHRGQLWARSGGLTHGAGEHVEVFGGDAIGLADAGRAQLAATDMPQDGFGVQAELLGSLIDG